MKKNNPFSRGIKQKKRRISVASEEEQEEELEYQPDNNEIETIESDETDVQILPSVPRKNFESQFPKIEKPEKIVRWPDINVCKWMMQTCEAMGLKYPTPIQENCIPPILKKRDAIASAPTGSGKTAAFAIPILQTLSEDPYGIYALILTPTRELAYQIAEQFTSLGAPMSVKVEVVIGGKDPVAQSLALAKKPHIVISTPGRLVDHLESHSGLDLSRLKFLVLDEADRLLAGESLRGCLESILEYCPPPNRRQTLLFSATMTMDENLLDILKMKDPFKFSIGPKYNTVESLRQEYMLVPAKVKDCNLVYLLRCEEPDPDEVDEEGKPVEMISIIVFVSTCKSAQLLNDMLRELGIRCISLHSALPQNKRLNNLSMFRSGYAKVLIATDVASRGLDIPSVELVINYDLPKEPEDYIHRVGRTARASRDGRALTLVTQYDVQKILAIEEKIGKKLQEFGVEEDEVLRHLNETTIAKTKAEMRLEKDEVFLRKTKRKMEAKEAKRAKLEQ